MTLYALCGAQVEFPLRHAWLLLRNTSGFLGLSEKKAMEFLESQTEDSKRARTLSAPISCCTKDVLLSMRQYISVYVDPDSGQFLKDSECAEALSGALTGAQCWNLLEAAHFLDVNIEAPFEKTLYNEVCTKLANLVVKARSIQEIRDFCGVTDAHIGFTPPQIQQNLANLHW